MRTVRFQILKCRLDILVRLRLDGQECPSGDRKDIHTKLVKLVKVDGRDRQSTTHRWRQTTKSSSARRTYQRGLLKLATKLIASGFGPQNTGFTQPMD